MAKAALPEPQFPAMQCAIPDTTSDVRIIGIRRLQGRRRNLLADGAVGKDPTQGSERGAYSRATHVQRARECGIAYGTRVLWRRSPYSSRTDHHCSFDEGAFLEGGSDSH